jgi:endonuclease YncB( thermonuclease family)
MSGAPIPAYVFKAELIDVHDGDTHTYRLDFGRFPATRITAEVPVRVHGLYCAELRQEGGAAARAFAHSLLTSGPPITVRTYKASFARTVGDVWVGGELFADLMRAAGHHRPDLAQAHAYDPPGV